MFSCDPGKSRKTAKKRAGFTLTEVAVVLGIVGLLLGGIWSVANIVIQNSKLHAGNEELIVTIQNTRAIFAEQGGVTDSGGGALTQALDQLKAFPLNMRQGGGTPGVIFNPWSTRITGTLGSVSVDADDCNGNANTTSTPQPCFGVTFFDVPQDACMQLLMKTSQTGLGLSQIRVNGTLAGASTGALPLPIPETSIQGDCNNGNAFGTNDILWEHSVKNAG